MGHQSNTYLMNVQKIHTVVNSLSPEQRNAVTKMKLAGILSVDKFRIDKQFVEHLIGQVNSHNGSIWIQGVNQKISHKDVGSILGIPSSGLNAEEMVESEGKGGYPVQFDIPVRGGYIHETELPKKIAEEEGAATDAFKTYFLLYVVRYFLAPRRGLNKEWSNIARHLKLVSEINWSKLVLDCLLESITVSRQEKQNGTTAIGGCVLLLMIYFFEKYMPVGYESRPTPRIKDWGKDELSNRIRKYKGQCSIIASAYLVKRAEKDHTPKQSKDVNQAIRNRKRNLSMDEYSTHISPSSRFTGKRAEKVDHDISVALTEINPNKSKDVSRASPSSFFTKSDECSRMVTDFIDNAALLEWFFEEKKSGDYVCFEKGFGVISGDGLYTLRPRGWIQDDVINAFEYILGIIDSDSRPRNLYLPTYFAQSSTRELSYQIFQRRVSSTRTISRCNFIYIPMNLNAHWFLIRADIQKMEAAIFDSLNLMSADADDQLMEILKSLHYCLHEHAKVDKQFSYPAKTCDWKISRPDGVPQQQNCDDCGVFVMLFMEKAANLTAETKFDTDKERRRIALQLLHHPGNEELPKVQVLRTLVTKFDTDKERRRIALQLLNHLGNEELLKVEVLRNLVRDLDRCPVYNKNKGTLGS